MTEEVLGVDVSRARADRIAHDFIRKDWCDVETALMGGKWFEYRFMNPVAATYLFAHELKKVHKRAYKRNIDTERGEYVKALPDDLFESTAEMHPKKAAARKRLVAGVWRARQVADAMGIPYNVYLDRAYHWTLRYWTQKYLPRPQHLYTDLVTDRTAIDWLEYQASRFYYSTNDRYTNKRYANLKAQDDHHEWLLAQIGKRGNKPSLIAEFFDEDLLPPDKVRSRLGTEVCADAMQLTKNAPLQNSYN